MSTYSVAFIGTGPNPDEPDWGNSAAMAYRHAAGYRKLDQCDLVACSDLVEEHAEAFAEEFDIDGGHVYEDYAEMLRSVEPDFVSVCTPVPTHADIVVDCIESGHASAIHCEKPMADTWGDARRMAETAADRDVQLTFNHQRRFTPGWRTAKRLCDEGTIGELQRVEIGVRNLFDHGTHLFDFCNLLNGERPAEWALAQIDYREENVRYGTHNENHAIGQWKYENGVPGIVAGGDGAELIGCAIRVVGTEGVIELNEGSSTADRFRRDGDDGWEIIESETAEDTLHLAIAHIVESFDAGEQPELSAGNALNATELIFGCYESVRKRGRVNFPLEVADNPLEALVESGEITPESAD
jgi:predicted dehydrogenase